MPDIHIHFDKRDSEAYVFEMRMCEDCDFTDIARTTEFLMHTVCSRNSAGFEKSLERLCDEALSLRTSDREFPKPRDRKNPFIGGAD